MDFKSWRCRLGGYFGNVLDEWFSTYKAIFHQQKVIEKESWYLDNFNGIEKLEF